MAGAVELEPVDAIRLCQPADDRRRLENLELLAATVECAGSTETGGACAEDDRPRSVAHQRLTHTDRYSRNGILARRGSRAKLMAALSGSRTMEASMRPASNRALRGA